MSVNPPFTPNRRTRRGPRERSTEEYLGAVRRMLRSAAIRVGDDGDEPELAALLALKLDLEQAIAIAVERQRARGRSWAMIAWATGTTRQGAYQRWGRRVSPGG